MTSDAAKIINRYKLREQPTHRRTIFVPVSNQQVNRQLKIIQEACEIPIPLTFHIARHTFAKTVALKNGIPLETVQLMMGHTKITTTQIYAEVDQEKILEDMFGFDAKLQAKRANIANGISNLAHPTDGLSYQHLERGRK